jgi:hypothetical protein
MKRNLSRLVLILEIAAIAIFHAIKLNQSEKGNIQTESIAHTVALKPDFLKIITPYLISQMK